MPRTPQPFYKWRIDWSCIGWAVAAGFALYKIAVYPVSDLFMASPLWVPIGIGLLIWILIANLQGLWLNRYPFVFTVKGDRAVRWIPKGRDEIIYEENGRRATIYSELGNKPDRLIYATSLNNWDSPHENEIIFPEQKRDIIRLLCEQYEYWGTTYDLCWGDRLLVSLRCPHCKTELVAEPSLNLGDVEKKQYHVGDTYNWGPPELHAGRPTDGNAEMRTHVYCTHCHEFFDVLIHICADVIERVKIDNTVGA